MVKVAVVLVTRYRSKLYELAGATAGVYALSHVSAGAAWGGVAVALLAKSLEADIAGRGKP